MRRREFLKVTAVSAVAGAAPSLWGCAGPDSDTLFPQGVASGDPKPDSVVLWTRAAPQPGSEADDRLLEFEVAVDDAFASVIATGDVLARAVYDHTVRLKVTGLEPRTAYWFRFAYRGTTSPGGRTLTAPSADDDVPIRLATASCQDYPGRYYNAWRALVAEDPTPDFVLFLGDYIYETDQDARYQIPSDDRFILLPDGQPLTGFNDFLTARTLEDYRALYRQYRTDPDLQEAHRLLPFVAVWDDHEFANDSWQDHTVFFDDAMGDEQDTPRREAATRAYFEYLPMDVRYDADLGFPDDLRVYRSLRFGRHVELFIMDQRYYRDDHAVAEGPINLQTGHFLPNTPLGSRILAVKEGFDAFEATVRPTMLGAAQLQWLIAATRSSTATWKLWGSPTMLAEMKLDLTNYDGLLEAFRTVFYFKLDHWDGYRSERAELLSAVADVEDLVVLTGDIHAFYAAELHVDFDAPSPTPVAPEYVTAGISSSSLAEQLRNLINGDPLLSTLGANDLDQDFDELLLTANPGYRHARADAYGYAVVDVDRAQEVRVTFVRVEHPSVEGGDVVERVSFRTPSGSHRIEPG